MPDALQPAEGFPRRFGSYVLLSAFAHGGMGEVYLAKHGGIEGIDRLCVLKKLRPDYTQNEEYVRRFIDEARVVVQLNHANICHVFDVGRVGNEYYLAMEYVSGVNVRALHHRAAEVGRRVPENVALWVVSEMLEALDYAHRHSHPITGQPLHLVHRDVSPQNVMVNYEGEVKLIDFGLAASDLKEEQTESQVVMGKVAYMSPEQARGEKVAPHTDQFAAGIVAYELLVGERFYGEMNNYQIWQVVGRGGFTPPSWTKLAPELQALLSRALHGDVKKRYPTCGDFKDALAGYLVTRHPTTSKRTVRALMRELFEDDTRKERSFLSRFADVSAAGLRESTGPELRSVSLLLPSSQGAAGASGAEPAGAAPEAGPQRSEGAPEGGAAQGGRSATGEMTEVVDRRIPVETTGTSVLERRVLHSSRRARGLAVAGALVVVGALSGYLGMRALQGDAQPSEAATDDGRARPDGARPDGAPPDVTRPDDKDGTAMAPAKLDGGLATEPASAAAKPDALAAALPKGTKPIEATDDDVKPAVTDDPSRRAGRPGGGRTKDGRTKDARSKDPKPKVERPRRGRGDRAVSTRVAAAPADPTDPQESSPSSSETLPSSEGELRAWRKRVSRHLEGCPAPCGPILLPSVESAARANLLPALKSIQDCIEQCAVAKQKQKERAR